MTLFLIGLLIGFIVGVTGSVFVYFKYVKVKVD